METTIGISVWDLNRTQWRSAKKRVAGFHFRHFLVRSHFLLKRNSVNGIVEKKDATVGASETTPYLLIFFMAIKFSNFSLIWRRALKDIYRDAHHGCVDPWGPRHGDGECNIPPNRYVEGLRDFSWVFTRLTQQQTNLKEICLKSNYRCFFSGCRIRSPKDTDEPESNLTPIRVEVVTRANQLPRAFLEPCESNPFAIGFDCEGVDLARYGRLCIMQVISGQIMHKHPPVSSRFLCFRSVFCPLPPKSFWFLPPQHYTHFQFNADVAFSWHGRTKCT